MPFHSRWLPAGCALLGMSMFMLLALISGRFVDGGIGYDGSGYARVVETGEWRGSSMAQLYLRPLVVAIAEVLYAEVFRDTVQTFLFLNTAFAGLLAWSVATLLAARGVAMGWTLLAVAVLGCSIATAKMYAYYPVLVDLGAVAFITAAVAAIVRGRPFLTCVGCIAAVLSREFGVVPVVFGVVHDWRAGRSSTRIAAVYGPALVIFSALQAWIVFRYPSGEGQFTPVTLLHNLSMLADPAFLLWLMYFVLTVFGAVSILVWARPRRLWNTAWREPEVGLTIGAVLLVTAGGTVDLWRYLLYMLPAVVLVYAEAVRDLTGVRARFVALIVVGMTLVTQAPWQRMTWLTYFRDWFPYYQFSQHSLPDGPTTSEIWSAWIPTFVATLIGLILLRIAVGKVGAAEMTIENAGSGPIAIQHEVR